MDKKVLYQIKSIDKLIFRTLMKNNGIKDCDFEMDNVKVPTTTQMHIIAYMLKNPEMEVNQRDLEEILNLRRATVSGVLHTMENNDLIVRVTDKNDSRKKKIILNDKAKEIFRKHKKKQENIEKKKTSGIYESDLNVFFDVVEKMKENIIKEKNI